jgi:hypothetical protein
MNDRIGISIRCMLWIDPLADERVWWLDDQKFSKLFCQKIRTYGLLFLYLCIRLRDMIIMIVLLIAFVASVAFTALFKDWIFEDTDWAEFALIWCGVLVVFGTIGLFLNLLIS